MAVKFLSKQSLETSQFYKVRLLNWLPLIVIVINVVIGGFSREDLKWIRSYNCLITGVRFRPTVRLHCPITTLR